MPIVKGKYVRPDFVYVGRTNCGCVMALCIDGGDKETARNIAYFIKSGLHIDRVSFQDYINFVSNEETFFKCNHNPEEPTPPADPQPSLFTDANDETKLV